MRSELPPRQGPFDKTKHKIIEIFVSRSLGLPVRIKDIQEGRYLFDLARPLLLPSLITDQRAKRRIDCHMAEVTRSVAFLLNNQTSFTNTSEVIGPARKMILAAIAIADVSPDQPELYLPSDIRVKYLGQCFPRNKEVRIFIPVTGVAQVFGSLSCTCWYPPRFTDLEFPPNGNYNSLITLIDQQGNSHQHIIPLSINQPRLAR